jgi:hypothetical protein
MPLELRTAPRRRLRHAAWISFGQSPKLIPCVLWDVSDRGARIAAAHSKILPDRFVLNLTSDGKDQRLCRIIWRRPPQVGVQFIRAG